MAQIPIKTIATDSIYTTQQGYDRGFPQTADALITVIQHGKLEFVTLKEVIKAFIEKNPDAFLERREDLISTARDSKYEYLEPFIRKQLEGLTEDSSSETHPSLIAMLSSAPNNETDTVRQIIKQEINTLKKMIQNELISDRQIQSEIEKASSILIEFYGIKKALELFTTEVDTKSQTLEDLAINRTHLKEWIGQYEFGLARIMQEQEFGSESDC